MFNLIKKELKISIHKFFFILPLMLAVLMFIPGWIYLLVFMYFFWISIPQIFSAYLNQKDYDFTSMLPVSKKDIVKSKAISMYIIESVHLLSTAIISIFHNLLYGSWNLFMDVNYSLFGVAILMYGIFNLVFLPRYFKTAYFFGKPLIIGVVVTVVYGFLFEFSAIMSTMGKPGFIFFNKIFEGSLFNQFIVLGVGLVLGVILSIVAIKKSIRNFESIQ